MIVYQLKQQPGTHSLSTDLLFNLISFEVTREYFSFKIQQALAMVS